jgi:hypothetical protein
MALRAELGMVAAGVAPAVGALGLTLWDASWKGGAFSLNLFKCCLASTCFVAVAVAATGGPLPLCARCGCLAVLAYAFPKPYTLLLTHAVSTAALRVDLFTASWRRRCPSGTLNAA